MGDPKSLDLRDWFAGQALAGILSNAQFPQQSTGEPHDHYVARVIDCAYDIAEGMISQGRRLKKAESANWQS